MNAEVVGLKDNDCYCPQVPTDPSALPSPNNPPPNSTKETGGICMTGFLHGEGGNQEDYIQNAGRATAPAEQSSAGNRIAHSPHSYRREQSPEGRGVGVSESLNVTHWVTSHKLIHKVVHQNNGLNHSKNDMALIQGRRRLHVQAKSWAYSLSCQV